MIHVSYDTTPLVIIDPTSFLLLSNNVYLFNDPLITSNIETIVYHKNLRIPTYSSFRTVGFWRHSVSL